jgi:hypothetical protein
MGNQGIILKGDDNDRYTSQSSSPEELPPILFSMVLPDGGASLVACRFDAGGRALDRPADHSPAY